MKKKTESTELIVNQNLPTVFVNNKVLCEVQNKLVATIHEENGLDILHDSVDTVIPIDDVCLQNKCV